MKAPAPRDVSGEKLEADVTKALTEAHQERLAEARVITVTTAVRGVATHLEVT
ncbi:MAG: hypothetical protein M1298_01940 [Chloroflexi bacterium]|nr:hypothetical protein [Chloroflexota bacterium]